MLLNLAQRKLGLFLKQEVGKRSRGFFKTNVPLPGQK
jgi:hypothetical protein